MSLWPDEVRISDGPDAQAPTKHRAPTASLVVRVDSGDPSAFSIEVPGGGETFEFLAASADECSAWVDALAAAALAARPAERFGRHAVVLGTVFSAAYTGDSVRNGAGEGGGRARARERERSSGAGAWDFFPW